MREIVIYTALNKSLHVLYAYNYGIILNSRQTESMQMNHI